MANPFPARFDGTCQDCGDSLFEGDPTYAHEGAFVCSACVPRENICECGAYKKEGFDKCFACNKGELSKPAIVDGEEWG